MAISAFFRRALGEPTSEDHWPADTDVDADDSAAPEFDDETRLRVELRLARFRLEGISPDGPELEVAAGEVAALDRDLAALETRTPGQPSTNA
jgi:hypothetical protein